MTCTGIVHPLVSKLCLRTQSQLSSSLLDPSAAHAGKCSTNVQRIGSHAVADYPY